MTPKEKFIKALKREPIVGHVPHFELVFYLTMEAFGKVHPSHRSYYQWYQMSVRERELQIQDMADVYIRTAEKYHHNAIFVHPNPGHLDDTVRLLEAIRERTGDTYYLTMHGDPTFYIPEGSNMMEFSMSLYDEPEEMKQRAEKQLADSLKFAEEMAAHHPGLLDGFALCSDYCLNTNPFFSPSLFEEFIAPYLKRVIDEYRSMGLYSIKHTDGNIMPILEQIVECGPDAIHSLDPQGGVSIPEVRRSTKGRVALCGNVNCGLLQTGTEEECIADVRRSLKEGMEAPGYIFCTSNCVYTGMPLERYELMNRIWREEGIYNS